MTADKVSNDVSLKAKQSHARLPLAFGIVTAINVLFFVFAFASEKKVEADLGEYSAGSTAGRNAMQKVEKLSFEDIQAVSAVEEKAAAADVPVSADSVGGKPISVPDEQADAYREETPTGGTQQQGGGGPVEVVTTGETHDASTTEVEFVAVDEKARPQNMDSVRPEFPAAFRDNPLYQTKPVKVSLMVYVGSDGKVKNVQDMSAGSIPAEFKESARNAISNIEWIPAKVNGSPIGTWIAFDVRFTLK